MTNKKIISIIVSKIMTGEITFSELERRVRKQRIEEELKCSSKYFKDTYHKLEKWLNKQLKFDEAKKIVEIFEIIHDKKPFDVDTLLVYISLETGRKIKNIKNKLFDSSLLNIYLVMSECIKKYCDIYLNVDAVKYWESIDEDKKAQIIIEIEKIISEI